MTDGLQERCSQLNWFHSIDLGDFITSGRFRPGVPPNYTLLASMETLTKIDLSGTSVLDIGTVDGLIGFGVKAMGAARVATTDSHPRETFEIARQTLDVDVEYHPSMQIKDLGGTFGRGTFDVIVCAGVVYHMLNPASAFLECRKIIKENGLFLIETAYEPRDQRAVIYLNSEEAVVDEIHTYSVPTKNAILALMKLSGFDVLAVRPLQNRNRITVVGRACTPDEIRDRTPMLRAMHAQGLTDFEFLIREWIPAPSRSDVRYTGPTGEESIEIDAEVRFPFHPAASKPVVGSTLFLSEHGNRVADSTSGT